MQSVSAMSLVDQVTQEVKSAILAGTLKPGGGFSIVELSQRLGVSHIPVREALRHLEGEGLVTLRPGRSAVVTPLTVEELQEIYRLRLDIEVNLAARAAKLYDDDDLADAERLCAFLASRSEGNSVARPYWEAHHDLHWALLRPAAGAQTQRILERLWQAVERYTRLIYEAYPVSPDYARDRHVELVEAAKRRSAPEMRRLWTAHLTVNEQYQADKLRTMLAEQHDAVPEARSGVPRGRSST